MPITLLLSFLAFVTSRPQPPWLYSTAAFPSFYFPSDILSPTSFSLASRHRLVLLDGGAGAQTHAAAASLASCSALKRAAPDIPCFSYRQTAWAQSEFDLELEAKLNPDDESFWVHESNGSRWQNSSAWNFGTEAARLYYTDRIISEVASQSPNVSGVFLDDLDGEGCWGPSEGFPAHYTPSQVRDMYLQRLSTIRASVQTMNHNGQYPVLAASVQYNQSLTSCIMGESEWLAHLGEDIGFSRFSTFGPLKARNTSLCNNFMGQAIREGGEGGVPLLLYIPLTGGPPPTPPNPAPPLPSYAIPSFLVVARNYSYFGASTGWENEDWAWHEEYDSVMVGCGVAMEGPPSGPSDFNVWTRRYEHCTAVMNCSSGEGKIIVP